MPHGPEDGPNFFEGNIAMAFSYSYEKLHNFENQFRYARQGKEAKKFKWGVVTPPINPSKPGESPYVQIGDIYGCDKDSLHKDVVDKILNFVMSEKLAKATSHTAFRLPMHKKYAKKIEGINLDELYALKVEKVASDERDSFGLIPGRFFESFMPLFNKMFDELMKDKTKTVSEELNKLVMEGNKELIKARAEEKADKAAGKEQNGFR